MLTPFILYFRQIPDPATAHQREKKERQVRREKKKGIEAQMTKAPTSTRASDALIRDEEQNGKQKKETGNWTPTQLHFLRLLRAAGIIR